MHRFAICIGREKEAKIPQKIAGCSAGQSDPCSNVSVFRFVFGEISIGNTQFAGWAVCTSHLEDFSAMNTHPARVSPCPVMFFG